MRHPDSGCVEEVNCDWEKITLCAFSLANVTKSKVSFLTCMDKREGSALSASKPCAAAINVNEDALTTCFKGDQGSSLLAEASKVWNKAYPGATTIPHTLINGVDTNHDYASLKKAICAITPSYKACQSVTRPEEGCLV